MGTISPNDISEAVKRLQSGQLVAFPTETVYGLGADATNPIAVKKIYELKGRPVWHPLIVHIANAEQLHEWVEEVPSYAKLLTEVFWPGPLTIVAPRKINVPDSVTGGLDTVAVRAPANPVAQELLAAFGGGIAAPSANKFGRVSSTTAQHVLDEFQEEDLLILDDGPSEIGLESTIAQLLDDEIVILRPGEISAQQLQTTANVKVSISTNETQSIAPGMLPSHYAPKAEVVIADNNSALEICQQQLQEGKTVFLIDEAETEASFAQHLYDRLRTADRDNIDVVVVVPPPPSDSGLSAAIRDRLSKASAERT